MNNLLISKLKQLPINPGIYFFKNTKGEIIYIGKAAILKNRVKQYFYKSRINDPKTELLITEIIDVDWQIVDSEAEALFLEAEMVKRYMPKYNILLRDDKSSIYIRINIKALAPSVTYTRRPLDDGAEYFGPFLQAGAVYKALKILRKIFPYSTHKVLPNRACLDYHLGLCPGPEIDGFNRYEYLKNLNKLKSYIKGKSKQVVNDLNKEMKQTSKVQNFEQATLIRNQLTSLKSLQNQIVFGDKETVDLSKDQALADITKLFSLNNFPKRIEAYDISHQHGSDTVASMIVFNNGAPSKTSYRKFKMRQIGNDDYLHIKEVVSRRFSAKNIKQWGMADLILIDGGKGQLSSAINAISDCNIKVPIFGITKKYEELIIHNKLSNILINHKFLQKIGGVLKKDSNDYYVLSLPSNSHIIKLLQRIRDESHRFAISYHSVLKINRQSKSALDGISGIGPKTKKKLLRNFGSYKGIALAKKKDIVSLIGKSKADSLISYIESTGIIIKS